MYIPCSYSHSDPVRSGSPPRPSAPPFAFRCTAARRTPPPSTVAGQPPAQPAGGSFSAGGYDWPRHAAVREAHHV